MIFEYFMIAVVCAMVFSAGYIYGARRTSKFYEKRIEQEALERSQKSLSKTPGGSA